MQTIKLHEDEQEFDDRGSFNHSLVQANLTVLFRNAGNYTVLVEPSLDSSSLDRTNYKVKDEMIPDVCVYEKRPFQRPFDTLRMTEMPLLVVEVLSPRQWAESLVQKFDAYFALGIQSCWLVNPITEVVHVYTSLLDRKTFSTGNVEDNTLTISFPIAQVFE